MNYNIAMIFNKYQIEEEPFIDFLSRHQYPWISAVLGIIQFDCFIPTKKLSTILEEAYTLAYFLYITVGECEGLRGAAGGRVAMMLKRDREHSDWPIVVQRSDNAGNWPSLDKTAKWSAATHSGATATLFQSRKSSGTPSRPPLARRFQMRNYSIFRY